MARPQYLSRSLIETFCGNVVPLELLSAVGKDWGSPLDTAPLCVAEITFWR